VRFMGKGTFAVQAIPPSLKAKDLPELLADAADDLSSGGSGRSPEERVQRVLATMACHASVRAGQELSPQEMMDILRALDIVDFGVCAHGRPVIVRLDVSELERRFHRS
jgi:DNA mismatch repair protein MutL